MMPAVPPGDTHSPPTLRGEMIAAYAAAFARVVSWLVILGVIWRVYGPDEMAAVALVRAMLSLLNYALLGIGPAALFYLARQTGASLPAAESPPADPAPATHTSQPELALPVAEPLAGPVPAGESHSVPVLDYAAATPPPVAADPVRRYLAATHQLIGVLAGLGMVAAVVYAVAANALHDAPAIDAPWILALGLAMLARFVGDAYGSAAAGMGLLLQDCRRVFVAEIAATFLVVLTASYVQSGYWPQAGATLMAVYALAMYKLAQWRARLVLSRAPAELGGRVHPERRDLLRYGSGVTLSQLADFLYAPAAFLIIDRFFATDALAWYAPAAQFDAALLLLVGAPAAVLFARGALAHGRGDRAALRQQFIRGSLACFAVLAFAAAVVWFAAPTLLRLWLGRAEPVTLAILPLVLLHTVLGGAGGIARSTLLAIGRVRDYTLAALVGGVLNVVLAIVLIKTTELGLYAIPLATCISVALRCLLWQPLLVLSALRPPRP